MEKNIHGVTSVAHRQHQIRGMRRSGWKWQGIMLQPPGHGSIPRTGRLILSGECLPGKGHVAAGKSRFFVGEVADGPYNGTEGGISCAVRGEETSRSQTEKPPALSQYERFAPESLYRQAETEAGYPPNAQARQRIREEYIASPGKDIPQIHPYRRHKKPGIRRRHFTGNRAVP